MTRTEQTTVLEYTLPEWALCYLVKGDDSGLNDDEINLVDSFVMTEGFIAVGTLGDDPYFSHTNDIGGLACNVYDVECLVKDQDNA